MTEHHVFAADWLALREPADHAARSRHLLAELARYLQPIQRPLNIVDLGAGSGSNLRWLAPRLAHAQHWTLVDRDPGLLAHAAARAVASSTGHPVSVTTVETDLSRPTLPWIGAADLVTAAAFFDLTSAEWIDRLSASCAQARAAGLFVLSVDGRWDFFNPAGDNLRDEDDRYVESLFNQHQRRDKGLGGALGPDAAARLAASLSAHGMTVSTQPSDWQLAPGQATSQALGRELIAGWGQAAREQAPQAQQRITAWQQRRQADLAAGRLGLRVGHVDVLALPPQP